MPTQPYNPYDLGLNTILSDAGRQVNNGLDYFLSPNNGLSKEYPVTSAIVDATPGLGVTRQIGRMVKYPKEATLENGLETTSSLLADIALPITKVIKQAYNIPKAFLPYLSAFIKAKTSDEKMLLGLLGTNNIYDNTGDWGGVIKELAKQFYDKIGDYLNNGIKSYDNNPDSWDNSNWSDYNTD